MRIVDLREGGGYPPSSEGGSVEALGCRASVPMPCFYPPSSEGGSVEASAYLSPLFYNLNLSPLLGGGLR